MQQTISTGAHAVRLAATDYLTKRSSAAPIQDGVIEHHDKHDANKATQEDAYVDDNDNASTDDDTGGTDTGEYE